MSQRFHISPKIGPAKCSAKSPESCDFRDSPHFDTMDEAVRAFELETEKKVKGEARGDYEKLEVKLQKRNTKTGPVFYDPNVLKRNKLTLKDFVLEVEKVRVGDNRNAVAHHLEHGVCTTEDTTYHAMVLAHADTSMNLIRDIPVQDNGVRDWREINELMGSWRNSLVSLFSSRTGSAVNITPNNSQSNNTASDLIVQSRNEEDSLLEAKFGYKTDINSTANTVSKVLGTSAFNLSKEQKEELVDAYRRSENECLQKLNLLMENHAEEFNHNPPIIDSSEVYKLAYSSGTHDEEQSSPYDVVVFRNHKKHGPSIEVVKKLFTDKNTWTARAEITRNSGTPRLNYVLKADNGATVRLMANNKNSNVVDGVRIPSKFQTGRVSYNGWVYGETKSGW